MKKLKSLLALAGAFLAGAAPAVHAAEFPERPVTIVVPFTAGGSSDAIARTVAQHLSKKWNQPVLIENRAGGNTVIATSAVAKAKADGHTILYNSFAWITNQFLAKDLPYKTTDLAPITLLGRYPLALYVRSNLPVNTVAEFIDYAKKSGKPVTFGTAGGGSSMHLAALEFSNLSGVNIQAVPYKGSIAALNDVIGGQVDAIFEGEVYRPHSETRKVKALFVGLNERMPGWSIPSATEVGMAKFGISAWFGLMVPAETPVAIRDKITNDVNEALRQPEVREKIRALGLVTEIMNSAQYAAYLEAERVKIGAFVARNRADLQ